MGISISISIYIYIYLSMAISMDIYGYKPMRSGISSNKNSRFAAVSGDTMDFSSSMAVLAPASPW